MLEIISPAGFERNFPELAADSEAMPEETAAALDARFALEVDVASIEPLCAEHGIDFPVPSLG